MDQSWFALAALLSWPLVSIMLFRIRRPASAAIWTILGGQLLLPVDTEIKLAMIPQLDKSSIPNICALIGCAMMGGRPGRLGRKFGLAAILLSIFILGPVVTSLLNNDAIHMEFRTVAGVGYYDGFSAALTAIIRIIPFLIGRRFLVNAEDLSLILAALVVGEAAYTLPLLFEIRFSPQFHLWVYDSAPFQFAQSIRDGGFRPSVFMGHGLLAALFLMTGVLSSTALWRTRAPLTRLPGSVLPIYLATILVLCKSLGAAIYAFSLCPLIAFTKPTIQARVATFLVVIALSYPLMRTFDLFPVAAVLEISASVSSDRAQSLETRFLNETALLQRASQRIWLGWGRYGRSRIYDEYGKDITLTDGEWIIALGQFGLLGFVAEFGLLSLGVFKSVGAIRRAQSSSDALQIAALSLIVAVNVVDLLPNSGLEPWTWLLSGALLGRCEKLLLLSRNADRTVGAWKVRLTDKPSFQRV